MGKATPPCASGLLALLIMSDWRLSWCNVPILEPGVTPSLGSLSLRLQLVKKAANEHAWFVRVAPGEGVRKLDMTVAV